MMMRTVARRSIRRSVTSPLAATRSLSFFIVDIIVFVFLLNFFVPVFYNFFVVIIYNFFVVIIYNFFLPILINVIVSFISSSSSSSSSSQGGRAKRRERLITLGQAVENVDMRGG
ncbi:hypothetical protein BV898_14889 [Hypsibius exemplaris]|uniref:Uncharacterized protein n=1 Tax=Hypsibius exemplaris TaxID=2072580 RepID=A0A9X6N9G5_HYPEX|nr:hypothetical protein BV898_14889 [Hypsibius exemplaris]